MSELVTVEIFDTTLRDGAQALPSEHQFPSGSKPEIAEYIASLGVGVIEAGFPATPGDAEDVREVARMVGTAQYKVGSWRSGQELGNIASTPSIAGLARVNPADIEATWAAVEPAEKPRIHTFVSTDEHHMRAKFPGKTPDQVLAMAREGVAHARQLTAGHPNATVEFSAEAATTTDMNYLERVIKTAIEAGADVVNVPDTVGQRNPFQMYQFYSQVAKWVLQTNPNVTISAHNHNDLGMAAANTWALTQAAADVASKRNAHIKTQVETTVCGLGERAGNADVFPILAEHFKFSGELPADVEWQCEPGRAVEVARCVMSFAGYTVDPNSPIVGLDTFVHRSGIHSDGVIKGGHEIYTPHDPEFWGHTQSYRIEDGAYQGSAGKQAIAASH